MKTNTCGVRGCDEDRKELFTALASGAVPLEWAVCQFHGRALDAGETYSVSADGQLLLGSETALEIVNLLIDSDGIGDDVVTLVLGHDQIEEQRVVFQMKPEHARSICYWVANGPHTHDGVEDPEAAHSS